MVPMASSPPDPPPGGRHHGLHRRRRRWPRRLAIGALSVVVLAALLAAGGYAYLRYRVGQIGRVAVPALSKTTRPAASTKGSDPAPAGLPPMNVLLVGNNSRCILNGKQAAAFGTCAQVGGGRSDVTMILHLDPATHRAALLSIPRDLWLPIPGTHKALRVDDALNVSPQRLVETIQDDLGIPINHFVELNFDSFQKVVDDLGGLDMYFPVPVKDAYSGLDIATTGCLHLNGTQALQVVRARHMYYLSDGTWHYDGLGDLSRIQRDHEFLKALAGDVIHSGLANPIRANSLLGDVLPHLKVDSALTLGTMVGLVRAFRHVDPATVPSYTLPISYANNYLYDGASYGDVVMPLEPLDQRAIDQALGVSQPPGHSVAPGQVDVRVLNGSGEPGQAGDVAGVLGTLGFHVVGTGDTTITGQPAETVVRYAAGHRAQAERVAQALSGEVAMGEDASAGNDVVVVTGTHLAVAGPPAPSPASTAPAGTASTAPVTAATAASPPSSTTSTTAPSAAGVAPVLPAQPKLPSYDPRACPAGAIAKPARS